MTGSKERFTIHSELHKYSVGYTFTVGSHRYEVLEIIYRDKCKITGKEYIGVNCICLG